MWRDPDGNNRLIAGPKAGDYVNAIYPFDEHIGHEVTVRLGSTSRRTGTTMTVEAGAVSLVMTLGRLRVPFPPRPRLLTATVEQVLSQAIMGVRTYGSSPTGVEEWYRSRSLRLVGEASGTFDGIDMGVMAPLERPLDFGFTDPPRRPMSVDLRVGLRRPIT